MKKLIVFDLDGTLAESKAAIDDEMSALLAKLLDVVRVAVISGGGYPQFDKQLLAHLPPSTLLKNLSILPTCGTKFLRYDESWSQIYSEDFTAAEKAKILTSMNRAIAQSGVETKRTWGAQIEDRGSQITYSALGQEAPLDDKKAWDPDFAKRKKIKAVLDPLLTEFAVHLGGSTSIDVTKLGVDKGYGIRKLRDVLKIKIADMIFIGDALFPGGNDYPAEQAGAVSIRVRDPEETKRVVETILACLDEG